MKYVLRIAAVTWLMIDIITWFLSIEWAITIAVPIGLLLMTLKDDVEVESAQKRPIRRQA
ncbi:hypothetical protein [Enterococcus diestrammenae]|uniref:hypothetical protein n=1 Tax=Enterococcus diestrammenae TaxID=1155073 RepID=UPI001959FF9B